nr:hypothetical protein [Tanacetum cinerariifolium]
MNQNFFNSNSSGFDQFQPPQYPVIYHPPQETSVKMFHARENLMKYIQTFLKKFDCISSREKPIALLQAHEGFSEIKQALREEQHQPENIQELIRKLLNDLKNLNGILLERGEHAAQICPPYWKYLVFYDNDNEYTIEYRECLENLSNAITPDLPTEEPDNSLSMGNEHLSTILEKESDEVIKSSVENLVPILYEVIKSSAKNLVPIPSEYEVTSNDESECDVPVKDESSPAFTTFSNPLFDDNDDFTSSNDESLFKEDVPMENFKVYSNPLFDDGQINSDKLDPYCFNVESDLIESLLNRDTLIDSSPKFDFLLKEFSGKLAHIDPIIPGIKKADFYLEEEIRLVENLLYDNSSPRPPKELNAEIADTIIESLSHSPIPVEDGDSLMDEIDLFLATNDLLPPGIESDGYDSEGDIHFLEELLSDDSIPLPENDSSYSDHHDDLLFPRPPPEPPDVEFFFNFEPDSGELISVVKNNIDELNEDECFDPGGEIDVFTSVEDDDYFPFIFVIRIFLPYLIYPEVSPLLLSTGSEDTIFDPGISA